MITIELGEGRKNIHRTRKGEHLVEYGCHVEWAQAEGIRATEADKGAIGPLCRRLLAAGFEDQPWQATRDGKPVLSGKSIRWMAEHDCVETDGPPRYVPYKPSPFAAKAASS